MQNRQIAVSERRERAHRLYVTLFVALAVFLGGLLQLGIEGERVQIVLRVAGFAGMILAASWYVVGRSYRQLNSGKFKALQDLEKKLAYPFYTREWELLGEGKSASRILEANGGGECLARSFLSAVGSSRVVSLVSRREHDDMAEGCPPQSAWDNVATCRFVHGLGSRQLEPVLSR